MSFSPMGNGIYEDSHEVAANEIKSRPHTVLGDWLVGFELYVEGFSLSFCDNPEQEQGWRYALRGEEAAMRTEWEAAMEVR